MKISLCCFQTEISTRDDVIENHIKPSINKHALNLIASHRPDDRMATEDDAYPTAYIDPTSSMQVR